MPAAWQAAMVAAADARGGSRMRDQAEQLQALLQCRRCGGRRAGRPRRRRGPGTRRAASSSARSGRRRSDGGVVGRAPAGCSSASGAPLQMIRIRPPGCWWTVVIRLRSLSNGSFADARQTRARRSPGSQAELGRRRPAAPPRSGRRRPSTSVPASSGGRRAASLHSTRRGQQLGHVGASAAVSRVGRRGRTSPSGRSRCRRGSASPCGVHSRPGDHAALGEGAGLVGGQHGHRAEGLHRGQPADQGVAGGHPPGAQGQRRG